MSGVRRVIIVGGDANAWLAAASLKRAFGRSELGVCVLDVERTDAPVARSTLPSLRGTHSLIGIKEPDFIRRTGATFKLATEHHGWHGPSSRYLHAFGEIGSEMQGIPFYKYLLLQATLGRREDHEIYSLAAIAARAGRFARPMSQSALTSSFTYAFHVDESRYAAYLREHAEKLGVEQVAGRLDEVSFAESGDVAALVLQNGERLEADFFIDCSGRDALLMSRVSEEAREDWSGWLINDRVLSARAPALEQPRALTETTAQESGWLWRMPLAQSAAAGFVYSSAFLSDEAAAEQLRAAVAGCSEDMVCTRLAQGRRKLLWDRNCLALGDAAIEIEPLAGANLHIAQLGIATLIELFPLERTTRLEAMEYNRIVGEYVDSVRDFTIAHYTLSTRAGEYWTAARAAALPARLQHKLDLYRASARINQLDDEVFDELDWAWVLLGNRCVPDRIGVHTRSTLDLVRREDFAVLRDSIARLATTMPRHLDFVRQHG